MAAKNTNTLARIAKRKALSNLAYEISAELERLEGVAHIARAAFTAPGFDPEANKDMNAYGLLTVLEDCLKGLQAKIKSAPPKLAAQISGATLECIANAITVIEVAAPYVGILGSDVAPSAVTLVHTLIKDANSFSQLAIKPEAA